MSRLLQKKGISCDERLKNEFICLIPLSSFNIHAFRTLQDIEKPRKFWTSEILTLLTRNWERDAAGQPVATEENLPEKLSDQQLLKLLKMNYIACDEFNDCSPQVRASLVAQRRRNKMNLLDAMREEKNSIFLKLMKDRISGFQVEGFVKPPVLDVSETAGVEI